MSGRCFITLNGEGGGSGDTLEMALRCWSMWLRANGLRWLYRGQR